jgi:branched-chain amino acid transport system substrate-binding protein
MFRKITSLIVLVSMLALALTCCTPKAEPSPGAEVEEPKVEAEEPKEEAEEPAGEVKEEQPQVEKVVTIGVVGPLTGPAAFVGLSQLTGAQMKANEINAAGGDIRFEILSEDDTNDCDQSVNITTRYATRDNVQAVFGAPNSVCALAMVPLTLKYEVPHFTVGVGNAITEQGSNYIFRVNLMCSSQANQLAKFAHDELGHTKFAVFYADDEYGASCASGFTDGLAELGLEDATYVTAARDDKEFSGQLATIKESGATAIYITIEPSTAALITKQLKEFGLDLQVLGDTGNATPTYAELAGDAAVGAVVVEPFSTADPNPEIQDWIARYTAEFERDPDAWVAEMYDTVGLINEAVSKADAAGTIDWTSPESIRQVIRDDADSRVEGDPYVGILGGLFFDDVGNGTFSLYKVRLTEGGGREIIAE